MKKSKKSRSSIGHSKNIIEDNSTFTRNTQPNSIIYEEPELTTTIQIDDPLLKTFQKFQKKVERGSMFNSTITLISFSPLIIIFFLRFTLDTSGILLCLFLISLFGLNSFFTLYLNMKVITQTQSDSYHSLLQNKVRNINLTRVYHFSSLVYLTCLNLIMAFMIMEMINNLFFAFSIKTDLTHSIIIICILFLFEQLPSLLHSDSFAISQSFAMFFFVIILLSAITLLLEIIIFNNINKNFFFIKEVNFKYSYCICIFSLLFNNNPNLPKEIKEMNYYKYKRGKTLIERTEILEWVVYISFSLFSYIIDASYNSNANSIMTFITIHKQYKNYPMMLFEILIIICLGFKIANNSAQMWDTFFMQFHSPHLNMKIFLMIVTTIIIDVLIFFLNEKHILVIISIGGCFCSYILEYVIPIYSYNTVFDFDEEGETKLLQPQLEQSVFKHSGSIHILNYIVSLLMLLLYLFGIGGTLYCVITNQI